VQSDHRRLAEFVTYLARPTDNPPVLDDYVDELGLTETHAAALRS
jgi:hypothetical protein